MYYFTIYILIFSKSNFIDKKQNWIILEKVCNSIQDFYGTGKKTSFTTEMKRKIIEITTLNKIDIKSELKTFLEKLNIKLS